MKKKIVALDQGEHLGGAERFLSELLTRLPKEYEVHLMTGNSQSYLDLYEGSSVNIHYIDLPRINPFGLRSLVSARRAQKEIKEKLKELKPDMVLSNTVRTHLLVSQLTRKMNIPLLWMAHDLTFPGTLLRLLKKYPKKVIACSNGVRKYYQKYMKTEGRRCDVLYPFGVHKEKLYKLSQIPSEKVIGMVGNFIPWKGHDLFIRMAEKIHQQFPDIRFQILGDVYRDQEESISYFKKCMSLVNELGLESVLDIHKSNKVLEDIAHWEILVHCSREAEPLGRVVLEGMAAGCTVIASDLGGPREIVKHDVTGLLCKPSLASLQHLVENLIRDEERRERLSREGKNSIRKNFMWEDVMKTFKNTLEKVMG